MSGFNAQLVARVRELMRLKMNASAEDALKSAPQDLQALCAGAQSSEEQRLLLRAIDAVSAPGMRGFLGQFEDAIQANFDEKIGWLTGVQALVTQRFADFDLLDDAVLAQQMALRKLVQKSLDEIDGSALVAVEIRMADMLGVAKADGVRNPIGPGTMLKAVRVVLERLVEAESVDALVSVFQPHITAGLNALYGELNEMFIGAGIRPDYRPQIERDKSNRQAIRKSVDGVQISQAMALRDLMPGSASSPIDLAAILATLLQGQGVNRSYGARMLADEEGVMYAQALSTEVSPEVLEALTRMQTSLQSEDAAGDIAGLRSAVDGLEQANEHPLDRLTGELVAVIFDFLLHEKALAETVRNEIARLQIVALKAALLDRSFFARREHPLRVLLDAMTEKGSDPVIDTRAGSDFVLGLSAIVDELTTGFESDLSLFHTACVRLEALGREAVGSQESGLEALTERLLRQEREAQTLAQGEQAVKAALNPDTPAFLRDFLERHWRGLLVRARLNADESGWSEALQTMEALIASVQPKTRQEMSGFMKSLPPLIKAVQKGMDSTDMKEEERRSFMDHLMQTHTAILAKARSGEVLMSNPPPAKSDEFAYDAALRPRATLLPERALVEFSDSSPPMRARLSWVSPGKTRYAFISASVPPRVFTAEELSAAIAEGSVRVLSEEDSPLRRALACVMRAPDTAV